jgi:hypothetical protein
LRYESRAAPAPVKPDNAIFTREILRNTAITKLTERLSTSACTIRVVVKG